MSEEEIDFSSLKSHISTKSAIDAQREKRQQHIDYWIDRLTYVDKEGVRQLDHEKLIKYLVDHEHPKSWHEMINTPFDI